MDANNSDTGIFYHYVLFGERPISIETEHWYSETCPDWSTSKDSRDTCVDYRTLTYEWE